MKIIIHCSVLLTLFLNACNSEKETSNVANSEENEIATTTTDEEQLEQLVRMVYEWDETNSTQQDFMPIADAEDIAYIGLDMDLHNQRVTELKQTGFFTASFIENYHQLALAIDEGLKTKKLEWIVGELPSFGSNANPWCNCQDYPDDYWKTMTIKVMNLENNTATFTWTWGEDFEYQVKAIKENDQWKISYLQGFDLETYF